jgi:Ca2+-binding EF-hand superfamily protein
MKMMMSTSKVLTDKHGPEKRVSRAGLRLFLLLTVLALVGCYPASYREVSRPMSANAAGDIFDKIDTDGNKIIDKKEYTDAVSKSFDKLDKNMDSYLDREEFKAIGIPNSDELFDELDTNKDGRISKDEFVKGAEKHFTIMDKNDDGFIDRNEFNLNWEEGVHANDIPFIKPFIIFHF